ncbi:MAG: TauD/TfdA family dioxygenase [Pseudomonadota bacterium]
MSITVTPVDATLGAIVTDVDLSQLTDEVWEEVHAAFLKYGVLIFPGQHLDEESQGKFALRFGDTEKLYPQHKKPTLSFTNKRPDGSLSKPGEESYNIMKGNEGWHTDSTYMPLASKAAMLAAVTVPPEGGQTEFADMRAAWEALDEETQAKLEKMSAYHSLYYSQYRAGFTHTTDNVYGLHDKGAPLRAVIKTHPETGRKSIYTGRHAYGIQGMDPEESRKFLDELMENSCQAPRVYSHNWTVGDLIVWDNRCVMHRARPFNPNHARELRASRISGDPATELAPTFADERAADFNPSSSNLSSLSA